MTICLKKCSGVLNNCMSKQDQGSQVAPQVKKYQHTFPKDPWNKIMQLLIMQL